MPPTIGGEPGYVGAHAPVKPFAVVLVHIEANTVPAACDQPKPSRVADRVGPECRPAELLIFGGLPLHLLCGLALHLLNGQGLHLWRGLTVAPDGARQVERRAMREGNSNDPA